MISPLKMAIVCHEVTRAYSKYVLDDCSIQTWTCAPRWQRLSAVDGVSYFLAGPQRSPEDAHNHWLAHKIKTGWRYSPLTDAKRKEHSSMLPYSKLLPQVRVKDELFCAVMGVLKEHK